MPTRPCLGLPGQPCTRLTSRPDSRCDQCASRRGQSRDARRGSRHQRGYDADHVARRAALLPAAIGKPCPRCGQPMLASQDLDLDHSTPLRVDRTSRGDRMTHARCNRGARN